MLEKRLPVPSPRVLVPVALLPLAEPVAVQFARHSWSILQAVGSGWLVVAPWVRLAAFGVDLLAAGLLVRYLTGRPLAEAKTWTLLLIAGFFSLATMFAV